MPSVPASRASGRRVAAGMVIFYFVALGAAAFFLQVDVGVVWNFLGVPALPQHFADLHDIAVGIDRFVTAEDPWSSATLAYSVSAFSYPKWWLGAAVLGLNTDSYFYFGLGLALLFFLCALYVLGRMSWREGIAAGLVLVSPAVMTAIERGNGDLFIFAVLTFALAQRKSLPFSTGAILAAAFLKLYPAAALLALARPPWRRAGAWIGGALLLFGIDLLTSSSELPQIAHGILHMQWFSFGSTPILIGLIVVMPDRFDYNSVLLLGTLLYLLTLALAVWRRPRLTITPEMEREIFAFRIGASIFIGTFALGTNYDYRTMMLLFCLPLLFQLVRGPGSPRRWAIAAVLAIVVYTDWLFVFPDTYGTGASFFVKQLIAWAVLALLAALLAATFLPRASKAQSS